MRDLSPLGEFEISTEGWGLAALGRRLVLSDGTPTLYTVDPAEVEQRPLVEVTENGASLSGLNELEAIDGFLYANVYPTARVVKIDPADGQVVGWLDLSGLLADQPPGASVPNGIAHDPVQRRTFVTGKHWSAVHEIELS
jgi:glutamine cyclotransferase